MNKPLKLIKVGNSAGFIVPKELMARLHIKIGDEVYVTESPDGFRLTSSNPDFERSMQLAEDIMREDRDILRILAK